MKVLSLQLHLYYLFLLFIYCNQAYSDELVNLRFGSNEEKQRIVLDFSENISFDHKVLEKKIQIKFKKKIKINKNVKKLNKLVRLDYDEKLNKITLNFKKDFFSTNIYLLKKKKNIHARIVIDYFNKNNRKKIIIIDPGHGGKDSGAVGLYKNLEKNITLKVGLMLKDEFKKNTDFKIIWMNFIICKKPVSVSSIINKSCLKGRFNPYNFCEVDITLYSFVFNFLRFIVHKTVFLNHCNSN